MSHDYTGDTLTRLLESGVFSTGGNHSCRLLEEFVDPKLGELFYTECPEPKEIERKSKWLIEAYGPIAE